MLNVGYIIVQHMVSAPGIMSWYLPFGSIITRILKHFQVPITEPTFLSLKELKDEAIANLGFLWVEDQWIKEWRYKNKFTALAHLDHRIFNDVLPPDQLLDLNALQRLHPPPSLGHSHSTSADPEDPMYLLLTVHSISEQQSQLQS